MPTTHLSDITGDRLQLLYGLVKGLKLDIVKVIIEEINTTVNSEKYGLFFPSLITGLCKQAGVPWSKKELLCPIGPSIDSRVIKSIKGWEELPEFASLPTESGQASPPPFVPPAPGQAASSSAHPTGPSIDPSAFGPILSRLDTLTDVVTQGFTTMSARHEELDQRLTHMSQWLTHLKIQ